MKPAMRLLVVVIAWGMFVVATGLGQFRPPDIESALKPQIERAVARAVEFLRRTQAANGSWNRLEGGGFGGGADTVGCTALAVLAIMEGGVPVRDPAVERAIQFLRSTLRNNTDQLANRTYDISAAIWALNRYGDPDDQDLVRLLTCRVVKGQLGNGLWTYDCHAVQPQDVPQIVAELEQLRKAGRMWGGQPEQGIGQGDLSNTQFAVLALWIGRRYGVPTDPVLWKTAHTLRQMQNADGGWSYVLTGGNQTSTYAMTAAGLMCLSTGYGALRETMLSTTGRGGEAGAKATAPPDPTKDPSIVRANLYLATVLRTPFDTLSQQGFGSIPYTLWAIERVAMVYDWKTLGGLDWHSWGAMYFLRTQAANGSWDDNNRCGRVPCTAFGILFLMRSNLATDLTAHFRGEAVLRTGDDKPLTKAKPIDSKPDGSGVGGPSSDPEPRQAASLAEITELLITGSEAEKRAMLQHVAQARGGIYTLALAEAVPRALQANERTEFRRALVQRMSRLSVESLHAYLKHANPELRRAAAWAVALRDEQSLAPALVALLEDKDAEVAGTAYLALKALTGKDFGRSASAWKKYLEHSSAP